MSTGDARLYDRLKSGYDSVLQRVLGRFYDPSSKQTIPMSVGLGALLGYAEGVLLGVVVTLFLLCIWMYPNVRDEWRWSA